MVNNGRALNKTAMERISLAQKIQSQTRKYAIRARFFANSRRVFGGASGASFARNCYVTHRRAVSGLNARGARPTPRTYARTRFARECVCTCVCVRARTPRDIHLARRARREERRSSRFSIVRSPRTHSFVTTAISAPRRLAVRP